MPYGNNQEELGEEEEPGEEELDDDSRQVNTSLEPDGAKSSKKKKKKATQAIRINLSACKYEVLRIVQKKLGWKEVGDEDDWEIYWTDTSINIERIMKLTKVQKINHFNGMLELCRKRSMARNLQKIQKLFPEHYDFFPITYILPSDLNDLVADIKARGKKQIYILKPDAGCQGRGIRLIQGGKEEVLHQTLREMGNTNIVAQHYLPKPFLINAYKFDMRIYALVLSCDPLRVFIYKEGLARICTEKYTEPKASNLGISFMHLTNYAVNKKNETFVQNMGDAENAEDASKLGLEQLGEYIDSQGHDWDAVWESIKQLIMKSLISVQPILKNNYRSATSIDNDGFSCFEILGYDVMLDDKLRPWLIEVNHSPSFTCDSPLDLAIKEELISDTIQLVRIDPKLIAKTKKAEKKAAAGRLTGDVSKKQATAADGPSSSDASSLPTTGKAHTQKMVEELEAMRAEVLKKRVIYEEGNLGGYTRIYPAPDPKLQSLYEELLRGAAEIYSSAFVRSSKKASDSDDKKKDAEETESVKAQRLKAKAHRDRLAQVALERRRLREQLYHAQKDGSYPYYPDDGDGPSQDVDYSYGGSDYPQYRDERDNQTLNLVRAQSYHMPSPSSSSPPVSVAEAAASVNRLGFVSLPSSRPMSARSQGQGVEAATADPPHPHYQHHHPFPSPSPQSPSVSNSGQLAVSGSPASLRNKINPPPTFTSSPITHSLPPPSPNYYGTMTLSPSMASESQPGTSNNGMTRHQQISQIVLPLGVPASHQDIAAGGILASPRSLVGAGGGGGGYGSAFRPNHSHSQSRRNSSNNGDTIPPQPHPGAFAPNENGLFVSRSATLYNVPPGSLGYPSLPPPSPSSSQRGQRPPSITILPDGSPSGSPYSPSPNYAPHHSGGPQSCPAADSSYFRLDGTRVSSSPSFSSQQQQSPSNAQTVARPDSPSNFRYSRLHQQPVSTSTIPLSSPPSFHDPYQVSTSQGGASILVPGAAAVAATIHGPVKGRSGLSGGQVAAQGQSGVRPSSSITSPHPRGDPPVSPPHRQLRQAPLSIAVAPTYSTSQHGRPNSPSSASRRSHSPGASGSGMTIKPYVVLDPSRLGPLSREITKDEGVMGGGLMGGLTVMGRREKIDSRR